MSKKKKKILIILIFITFISVKVINLAFDNFNKKEDLNNEVIDNEEKIEKEPLNKVYIDIEGAVLNPGMYEVDEGLRLGEVIEIAGGLTHANTSCINLAAKISDEQYIKIPSEEEKCEKENNLSQNSEETKGLININTADQAQLETLTGIGKTRAQDIISYRNENGNFSTKEDLKNVSGIGDATYDKIKDQITI